jgi:siroheme synthase-like protein
MFVKLEGRRCLVVGAGKVGEPKIASLIACGARVRVVALAATEQVEAFHRDKVISLERRAFDVSDLDGVFLVVAATNCVATNELIFRQGQHRRILCNVVDDPAHCDFFYPAVVRRGPLQIAISTAGRSPALAQRLRREFETQFGEEYGEWLEELGRDRQQLFNRGIAAEERRRLLHDSASRESFEARGSAR